MAQAFRFDMTTARISTLDSPETLVTVSTTPYPVEVVEFLL